MSTLLQEDEKATMPRRPGAGRVAFALAALLAAGIGLSGCSSSSGGGGDDNVASQGSNGGNSAANDTTDPLVKYSACMREKGVPSFPDPVNGRLQLQARKGSDLDPDSAAFKAAQTACKSLEPAGIQKGVSPGGDQQNDMLKFVECMRKNGVANFPDPQPDGRMLLDPSSGIDPNSSTFQAAQEACRKLLPGGVAPGQ